MHQQLIPIADYESLLLSESFGRIIAKPIYSTLNIPQFDNAAMDGYAIRFNDILPSRIIPIAGKSFAGKPFDGEWPLGSTIQIMTGARIPKGCMAIIMQEHIEKYGNGIILKEKTVRYKQNIRYTGEEIRVGDLVLNVGVRLGTAELTVLASLGIYKVSVFRRPKVAIFSIGNELQAIDKPLIGEQIYDTNRFAIKMMLSKLNCEITDLGIIPDNKDKLFEAFKKADNLADIVISTGGVSVGEADFTKEILKKLGRIIFWKLAIKPGKPFIFGQLENSLFCGLPGNPVSAIVTFYQLVQPFLNALAGRNTNDMPLRQRARNIDFLKKSPGRMDFQRGICSIGEDGTLTVRSTGSQDSHILSSFTLANCFIVLECNRGNVQPGEFVEIEKFNNVLKR